PSKPEENDKTGTPLDSVPAISTIKGSSLNKGEDGLLKAGDIVTYTYQVTNIGNVSLMEVNLTENQADFSGTGVLPEPVWQSNDGVSLQGTLLPEETAIFTANYTVTAEDIASTLLNNRAVGTGTPPNAPDGTPATLVTDNSDSSNPNDPNETGTPSQPGESDKTGTPLIAPGVVAGTVYEDTNGDGIQGPSERGIPNVTVIVIDAAGNEHTLITDENGNYARQVPAGETIINIDESTLPPSFTQTQGTDTTLVSVPSGGMASDVDGYKPPANAGSVTGIVYEDTNGNGTQDTDEPGIAGVSVLITDSTGGTQNLITDATGAYKATVPAGNTTIFINESTLPGNSTQTQGSNATTVVVPANGTTTDVDGYQPPDNAGKVTGVIFE
ncbi:MAG: hypothetical protein KAG66_03685, partial [Methylococcales bacterium]|nr:hypothetical protein [Methylococcales bacterium]